MYRPLIDKHNAAATRRRGFTVVELLTAVFVTMIMMLLISRIFSDTSGAVGDGIHVARALANTRSIHDQVVVDFQNLLGPRQPGTDAPAGPMIIVNRKYDGVPFLLPGGGEGTRSVRSDQLLFIKQAGGSNPIKATTPGRDDSFFNPATAQYARVFYGHGRVLTPTFSPGSPPSVATNTQVIGATSGVGMLPATHWVLTRQSLLFTGQERLTELAGTVDNFVQSFVVGSAVAGTGSTHNTIEGSVSDVSNVLLDQVTGVQMSGAWLEDDMPNGNYETNALAMIYNSGAEPMVRRQLNEVASAGSHSVRSLTGPNVAQTHPFLSGNCSDFIIEFAGDYDPIDSDLDTFETPADGAGDPSQPGERRQIRWYSTMGVHRYAENVNASDVIVNNNNTFNHTIDPSALLSTAANAGYVIFRHDVPSSWPWYVRIRYRLHDDNGRVMGRGNESGKWFEHVVALPRP